MYSTTSTSLIQAVLTVTALFSTHAEAAAINELLDASQWYSKVNSVDVPVNNTFGLNFGVNDASDGCPVGWGVCSATSCYPLDGAHCCPDGGYCFAGEYCDNGGCCTIGRVCTGTAPPPRTITDSSTSSTRTSTTSSRTTTTTSVSTKTVTYTPPSQSTDFGSPTLSTSGTRTTTSFPEPSANDDVGPISGDDGDDDARDDLGIPGNNGAVRGMGVWNVYVLLGVVVGVVVSL